MAKYAGRVGDGFICTSGKGMDLYTDKLLPAVEDGLEAAGRPSGDIARMIEIKLSYAPTREEALDNTRFWAPLSLSAEQKHQLDDPVEMAAAADRLPIEQVASRWIVETTPEAVVDAVRPYVDAGFDHLVFHAPGPRPGGVPVLLRRRGAAGPARARRLSETTSWGEVGVGGRA